MTEQFLKPCPFCGTIPIIHEPLEYSVEQVGCGNKKCPIRFEMMDSEEWNTRASNKDRELLVELSLPDVDFDTLCEEGYQSNTIKCGNKILMKSKEIEITERDTKKAGEAIIALKIRKHLEENP